MPMPRIGLLRLTVRGNKRALLVLTTSQLTSKEKVINMRKRRTWRDYKEMEDNWSWEKLGRNPDGTPHQSYAPVMPDPYRSLHEKPVWGPPEDRYEPYDGN